jgi:hypothetical protein
MKNKLHYRYCYDPWVAASVQFMTLDDHLYFENTANDAANCDPQYGNTINYVSVKLSKEINSEILLWIIPFVSKVSQQDAILNVPEM